MFGYGKTVNHVSYLSMRDTDIDEVVIHRDKKGMTIRLTSPIPVDVETEIESNFPMKLESLYGGPSGKNKLNKKVKIRYTPDRKKSSYCYHRNSECTTILQDHVVVYKKCLACDTVLNDRRKHNRRTGPKDRRTIKHEIYDNLGGRRSGDGDRRWFEVDRRKNG